MSALFSPFTLRNITFKNRVFVSPMCQYSSENGLPNEWHFVHLGSRAVGGAGLVMVEATGVSPEGRISPQDMGLWSDEHTQAFKPITQFLKQHGAVPAIQLAHAGRKASTRATGGSLPTDEGAWQTYAPSALPFQEGWHTPKAMDEADIQKVIRDFEAATRRSLEAGFEVVEIHMAHGYLLHEFLSPLANHRTDQHGGSLANRMALPLKIAKAVRSIWPDKWPVFVRISASDWAENGWDLAQSTTFAAALKEIGIDLIDCSSGGILPTITIPAAPNYQVPFAEAIKKDMKIATGAVGMITEPLQAEEIIQSGKADVVFLARAMLRNPYWALHAAHELKVDVEWPRQYLRAK